eukprot:scaffold240917_cov30-Tisochrysis_lutea.AAC.3
MSGSTCTATKGPVLSRTAHDHRALLGLAGRGQQVTTTRLRSRDVRPDGIAHSKAVGMKRAEASVCECVGRERAGRNDDLRQLVIGGTLKDGRLESPLLGHLRQDKEVPVHSVTRHRITRHSRMVTHGSTHERRLPRYRLAAVAKGLCEGPRLWCGRADRLGASVLEGRGRCTLIRRDRGSTQLGHGELESHLHHPVRGNARPLERPCRKVVGHHGRQLGAADGRIEAFGSVVHRFGERRRQHEFEFLRHGLVRRGRLAGRHADRVVVNLIGEAEHSDAVAPRVLKIDGGLGVRGDNQLERFVQPAIRPLAVQHGAIHSSQLFRCRVIEA